MPGTVHRFDFARGTLDFWSLSDDQLTAFCAGIAQGRLPDTPPLLRAEAMRLYLLWREALITPLQLPHQGEKGCILTGLRKRTIQILNKLSLQTAERKALPSQST